MENLEKVRHITKRKLVLMILATTLPLIIVLVMSIIDFKISEGSLFDYVPFLPSILCVLFEGYLVIKIIQYIRILKNEEYANSLVIKKNDERNKYIHLKSTALTNKIFIYLLGIAVIYTVYVDPSVFWPCLSIFIVFVAMHLVIWIYYNKKY